MTRNTDHFDWKVFEVSLEELEIIFNSDSSDEDLNEHDEECREHGESHD
jgi:hypothetical protein